MRTHQHHVSAIITTYNRSALLKQTLESVLGQTRVPDQVIVVDDGSEDDTQAVLAAFGKSVQVIRQDNAGKPVAINKALPLVTGQYIWFFDDDDLALPNALETMVKALENEPELDFVATGHQIGRTGTSPLEICIVRTVTPPTFPTIQQARLEFMKGIYFFLQGVLVKKRLVDRVGRFDERLVRSQDYDYMIRMILHGHFRVLPEPTFILRHHPGIRGPRQAQHSESHRGVMWAYYDSLIAEKIRAEVPLSEYGPDSCSDVRRLLNRMEVMATKGNIPGVFDDMDLLIDALGNGHPTDVSYGAEIRWIVRKPHFLTNLQREDQDNLRKWIGNLARTRVGKKILLQMGVGLLRESATTAVTAISRWSSARLGMGFMAGAVGNIVTK